MNTVVTEQSRMDSRYPNSPGACLSWRALTALARLSTAVFM